MYVPPPLLLKVMLLLQLGHKKLIKKIKKIIPKMLV